MNNSYFIFSDTNDPIEFERFHLCCWEFSNSTSLVEIGGELRQESILSDDLTISIYVPWINQKCECRDLYGKLIDPENSRFIFNDSISDTTYLDGSTNRGVIHSFFLRSKLCIIPASVRIAENKIVTVKLDLKLYRERCKESIPNIYFRFWIKPSIPFISIRKDGISKSTIIYDIKINERRNIPDDAIEILSGKEFSKIATCFSFNILPNKYDLVFFDSNSLKNVRSLENELFNRYLNDKRVKNDELIVVFNKRIGLESFSFFSIYSVERIGTGQFAVAVLINIICGVLLFIPSYKSTKNPPLTAVEIISDPPSELIIALVLFFSALIYLFGRRIMEVIGNLFRRLVR